MIVENTLFSEREIHLVASESDSSKAQVDYCFVRRDQKKFVKDLKVALRKVTDTTKKVVPKKKIWR